MDVCRSCRPSKQFPRNRDYLNRNPQLSALSVQLGVALCLGMRWFLRHCTSKEPLMICLSCPLIRCPSPPELLRRLGGDFGILLSWTEAILHPWQGCSHSSGYVQTLKQVARNDQHYVAGRRNFSSWLNLGSSRSPGKRWKLYGHFDEIPVSTTATEGSWTNLYQAVYGTKFSF